MDFMTFEESARPSSEEDATKLKNRFQKQCKYASKVLYDADVLVVITGAGFSADSGLAIYADVANVPAYNRLGLSYHDLCQPHWLQHTPQLFYGFWGQCFNDYRITKPHVGYNIITKWKHDKNIIKKKETETETEVAKAIRKRILKEQEEQLKLQEMDDEEEEGEEDEDDDDDDDRKPSYRTPPPPYQVNNKDQNQPAGAFFSFTSNVDGHWYDHVEATEIYECHGNIELWQCSNSNNCQSQSSGIWRAPIQHRFVINQDTMEAPPSISIITTTTTATTNGDDCGDSHTVSMSSSSEDDDSSSSSSDDDRSCSSDSLSSSSNEEDDDDDDSSSSSDEDSIDRIFQVLEQQKQRKGDNNSNKKKKKHHHQNQNNDNNKKNGNQHKKKRKRKSNDDKTKKTTKKNIKRQKTAATTTTSSSFSSSSLGDYSTDINNDKKSKIKTTSSSSKKTVVVPVIGHVLGKGDRTDLLKYMPESTNQYQWCTKLGGDNKTNNNNNSSDNWPKCEKCHQLARPAILMFDDNQWVPDFSQKQRYMMWQYSLLKLCNKRYKKYKKYKKNQKYKNKKNLPPPPPPPHLLKVCILEIGCGMNVPTCRVESEQLTQRIVENGGNVKLIRINPEFPLASFPTINQHTIPIMSKGLVAIEQIDYYYNKYQKKEEEEEEEGIERRKMI